MRAIRVEQFGGTEVLQIQQVPDLVPQAGQVLVQIKAAGINPKDIHYRQGLYPNLKSPPYTPGIDGAGVILAIGERVTKVEVGDRVFITTSLTGTYAEQALCIERFVHHLPVELSFVQGAGLGVTYATAFRAIFQRARAMPGESILIHGASGGVGLAALQLIRNTGLFVIGTAGTKRGLELIKKEGVDVAICHKEPNYMDEIIRQNDGKKLDVILEMQAHLNLGKDLANLAKNGRVVVIGSLGNVEIDPQYLKDTDGSILSVSLFLATTAEMDIVSAGLNRCLKRGTLNPIIDEVLSLQDVATAHKMIETQSSKGKIILIP